MNKDYAIWAYRAIFAQSDVGGGDVDIRFGGDEGVLWELEYFQVGKDDYGSGRTITFAVLDEDGNQAAGLDSESTDNTFLVYPHKEAGATEDLTILRGDFDLPFSGTDVLQILAASLAQDETLTISLRAKLLRGSKLPTVDRSNSGGTVGAPTVTINRVI